MAKGCISVHSIPDTHILQYKFMEILVLPSSPGIKALNLNAAVFDLQVTAVRELGASMDEGLVGLCLTLPGVGPVTARAMARFPLSLGVCWGSFWAALLVDLFPPIA